MILKERADCDRIIDRLNQQHDAEIASLQENLNKMKTVKHLAVIIMILINDI